MTEAATKADLQATKADLLAAIADLTAHPIAAMDNLEAAIEAQTWRLTVRLGSILIAGMIMTGLLLFASVPLLIL